MRLTGRLDTEYEFYLWFTFESTRTLWKVVYDHDEFVLVERYGDRRIALTGDCGRPIWRAGKGRWCNVLEMFALHCEHGGKYGQHGRGS